MIDITIFDIVHSDEYIKILKEVVEDKETSLMLYSHFIAISILGTEEMKRKNLELYRQHINLIRKKIVS